MSRAVVIIDDDEDDLDVMKDTLAKIDPSIVCITFINPVEAIRQLENALILLPDFIFVDINMPQLTGMQCLEWLRKIDEFKETPIIIYSTSLPEKISNQLLANGATFTMQKPHKIEGYLSAIESIIFNRAKPDSNVRGVQFNGR
jgi:CheY-like chemotaxis protein